MDNPQDRPGGGGVENRFGRRTYTTPVRTSGYATGLFRSPCSYRYPKWGRFYDEPSQKYRCGMGVSQRNCALGAKRRLRDLHPSIAILQTAALLLG